MIKINLLPKDARKRVGIGERVFVIVAALLLVCGGIGFTWNYLDGVITQKKEQIAQTQQRLEELQKVIAEIEAFESQRAALEQKLAVIAKLQQEQQLPVHILEEIYLTLDDDLWLRSFSWSGASLNFAGVALSNPVVADYLRNLEESQYVVNPELGSSTIGNISGQEVRNFGVRASLNVPEDLLTTHFVQ